MVLPCQDRQPVPGADRTAEGKRPPVSVPAPEKRRSMLSPLPSAVGPRSVSVPELEPADPWPRVSVPAIPDSIPRDLAFRAALAIWDEGPAIVSRLGMTRADVKRYRWSLLAGEPEFNRFVERMSFRYGLRYNQLAWIARNLCDREILCDHLGLRITGRLFTKDGDRFPIKTGIARVVEQSCTCGLRCGVMAGVSDADNIRNHRRYIRIIIRKA